MKTLILFVFTVLVILNENGSVFCTNQNFQSGGHGIRFSSRSLAPTAFLVTFGVLPIFLLIMMFFNPAALKVLVIERPKIKHKQVIEETMANMDKPWGKSIQTKVTSFKTENTPEDSSEATKEGSSHKRRRRKTKLVNKTKPKVERKSNFGAQGRGTNSKKTYSVTFLRKKRQNGKSKDQALKDLDLLLKSFAAGKQKTVQGANEVLTNSSNATIVMTISPSILISSEFMTTPQNLTSSQNIIDVKPTLNHVHLSPKTLDIFNLFWQPFAPILFSLCFAGLPLVYLTLFILGKPPPRQSSRQKPKASPSKTTTKSTTKRPVITTMSTPIVLNQTTTEKIKNLSGITPTDSSLLTSQLEDTELPLSILMTRSTERSTASNVTKSALNTLDSQPNRRIGNFITLRPGLNGNNYLLSVPASIHSRFISYGSP